MTMNQDSMYQSVQGIKELNRVEGFDPRQYMRLLASEGQSAKYYLDVVYRKLWFRLKYPNGKIVKTLKKLTDQVAIVEARVYLDRNDPEDSFIANALAQKYMTTDDQFGNKYVELAETAAVGRALADAGFGLQFADLEGETDPNIVDAGLEHMTAPVSGTSFANDVYTEEEAGETLSDTDPGLPGQYDINDYMEDTANGQFAGQVTERTPAMSGNIPPAMRQTVPEGTAAQTRQASGNKTAQSQKKAGVNRSQTQPAASQNQGSVRQAAGSGQTVQTSVQDTVSRIQRDLPVEQIYKMLNRDMAVAIVISAGCYKGKTLGQLAVEKPQSLSWYVNDYKGPDNLLRAGAKFLLDAANQAA